MTQADPRHLRMRELLLQAGQRGTDPRRLAGWLNQENRFTTESDVRRWLDADREAGLVRVLAGGGYWAWAAPEPPVRCGKPADVTG